MTNYGFCLKVVKAGLTNLNGKFLKTLHRTYVNLHLTITLIASDHVQKETELLKNQTLRHTN